MNDDLEKIEQKKKILELKKKLLKEKERKQRFKQSIEIGKLACKANIDSLDKQILFGAFIEIFERSQKPDHVNAWKNLAVTFNQKSDFNLTVALSVSFKSDFGQEVKDKLKSLGFRWNKFRKEFYGYGNKNEIESIFNDTQCIVEVLE